MEKRVLLICCICLCISGALLIGFSFPSILAAKENDGQSDIAVTQITSSPVGTSRRFSPEASPDNFLSTYGSMSATRIHYMMTEIPATKDARHIFCKAGFEMEDAIEVLRQSSDQWTVFTCSPLVEDQNSIGTPILVDFGTRYTQINKNDGSKTWIIQHNTFDNSGINRYRAMLMPYRWTQDGRYVFLYPRGIPDPDCLSYLCYLYSVEIDDFYRFDLYTGEFELVLRREQFNSLGLSPDGKYLVYSEKEVPDRIHLINVNTWEDRVVELNVDATATGYFLWKTDNSEVIFVGGYTEEMDEGQKELSATDLYVLAVDTMQIRTIIKKDSRSFMPHFCDYPLIWVDQDTFCMTPRQDGMDGIFTYNLNTGIIDSYDDSKDN
jgi:hypothetical protein